MRVLIVWASVFFFSQTLHAETFGPANTKGLPINGQFESPGSHTARADHTVYRIDFKCTELAALPRKEYFADFFQQKSITSTHAVIIGVGDGPVLESGKLTKFPEKPIALFAPFDVNGNAVVDKRSKCPQTRLIYGTTEAFVFPFVSYSVARKPGKVFAIGGAIAELIAPLWAIFQPAAIPAAIATKLSAAKETKGPIEKLFSAFDEDETYGKSFDLRIGRYVVRTTYSSIEISVQKLPSIVAAKPDSLQAAFRASIDTGEKIKPEEALSNCNAIAAALLNIGFDEKIDIPYALVYASTKIGSRPKMVECLGDEYRAPAIALGPVLWKWIPRGLKLDDNFVAGLQPSNFASAKAKVLTFIVAMSRISKGDPVRAEEGQQSLKQVATEKIKLVDETRDGIWARESEISASELASAFKSKNYRRFGCMAPVGDKNGVGTTTAVGSLLAINAGTQDMESDTGSAIILHVIFKNGLISELHAFDDPTWITTNATANEGYCNNFKLNVRTAGQQSYPIDANRVMAGALRGSDFREGVASFMEKRPPRFTGE